MSIDHAAIDTKVKARLHALGEFESPDSLAAMFAEQGITGLQRRARSCPVARYLQREVNHAEVSVGPMHAIVFSDDPSTGLWDGYSETTHDLPNVVSAFVDNFDHSHYPELIQEIAR